MKLNPAVLAKLIPATSAMLPAPFQLGGPQMLEIEAAAPTPATVENEKDCRPSGRRAVNVLSSAYLVRGQNPFF